jgi:hypothetical protein
VAARSGVRQGPPDFDQEIGFGVEARRVGLDLRPRRLVVRVRLEGARAGTRLDPDLDWPTSSRTDSGVRATRRSPSCTSRGTPMSTVRPP